MSSPAFTVARRVRVNALASLGIGLVVVVLASLVLGSNPVPPAQVIRALLDPAADIDAVVWGSRVPRALLGLLVGICLGVAGAIIGAETTPRRRCWVNRYGERVCRYRR